MGKEKFINAGDMVTFRASFSDAGMLNDLISFLQKSNPNVNKHDVISMALNCLIQKNYEQMFPFEG